MNDPVWPKLIFSHNLQRSKELQIHVSHVPVLVGPASAVSKSWRSEVCKEVELRRRWSGPVWRSERSRSRQPTLPVCKIHSLWVCCNHTNSCTFFTKEYNFFLSTKDDFAAPRYTWFVNFEVQNQAPQYTPSLSIRSCLPRSNTVKLVTFPQFFSANQFLYF